MNPKSVLRADLYGADVPEWVIDAARGRHRGWNEKRPDQAPDVGLVFEWAVEYSGLPGVYRAALYALARLRPWSTWPIDELARRSGTHPDTFRKTIVPNLEAWGWVRVGRSGRAGKALAWAVSVPVDTPPDRIERPTRTPGKKPGESGHDARGVRARSPRYPGHDAL